MDTNIIDKFTTHLKNALTRALSMVVEARGTKIEPIHLLWALTTQKGSIGTEILHKVNITEEQVKVIAPKMLPPTKSSGKTKTNGAITPNLSEASKRAIEKAVLTATLYEHRYVGTEHMLSGLLQIEDPMVKEFLTSKKVELKSIRQQVTLVLKSTSKFPDLTASLGMASPEIPGLSMEPVREKKRNRKGGGSKTPALDFFSVDLTTVEAQAGIDAVIGRESEIERVMQILCRRTKNNPILLGEPGVGKTAIVEGLAKKMSKDEVPDVLMGKRILALDLSLIIAGTMYRGEFEGRLKQIIDEVHANPEIILFIDEVHTIIGAGASSGSLDAANILKPALARGDIHCIGATTLAEYKKHIESDAALERRFQSVIVNEPSPEKTLAILLGVRENYETFHRVTITKEALETAVTLADRYLQDKFFPDKAIDLIDEAASALRVRAHTTATQKKVRTLSTELVRIREEKRCAIVEERFMEAIALKERERTTDEALKKLERTAGKKTKSTGRITGHSIAEIISRMTGIPTAELIDTEKRRLEKLEEILGGRVLGQTDAVHAVAECIRRAKTGIAHPSRPLASFLFVGPSGVGKTELAKAITEEVFQDKDALIRLDMSEFAEGFTVTKLIGAPAGYVGYKDSAKLTDSVKRKPYSVVLFDELEKAHPDVLNLLLQILDEGHITDASGRKINFKNTIIVMTSNIGSEKVREQPMGFGAVETARTALSGDIRKSLTERFRPEFLNRIDRVCVFEPLAATALHRIVDLQINELNYRLRARHLRVSINEDVRNWIVSHGTELEQGARAIRRVIQDHLEGLVASMLLTGEASAPRAVHFVLRDEKPVIA